MDEKTNENLNKSLNLIVLLGIFLLNKTITKMSREDMEKSTLNITTSILEFVNKIKKLP